MHLLERSTQVLVQAHLPVDSVRDLVSERLLERSTQALVLEHWPEHLIQDLVREYLVELPQAHWLERSEWVLLF